MNKFVAITMIICLSMLLLANSVVTVIRIHFFDRKHDELFGHITTHAINAFFLVFYIIGYYVEYLRQTK